MSRKDKIIQNLTKNNISVFFAENKRSVVPIIDKLITKGDIVASSNSMSLFKCGVIEHLKCGKYNYLTKYLPKLTAAKLQDIYLDTFNADVYLCGCGAVTENGELYNCDCNSVRAAAISYGPKSVIIVVGWNSVVRDFDEAVSKTRHYAIPRNVSKMPYCTDTGADALECPTKENRITVIVVEENL